MLDRKEMAEEYVKAYTDKSRTYFMEKYLSTFDGTEGRYVPFVVFPRQKVYCQALADHNKVIPIKHRQCGISTCTCGWVVAECTFSKPDSPLNVLFIANKLEQACELVTKVRDFLMQVPRWYWGDEYYSDDPKSEKNAKDIFIKNSKTYLELCNGCKFYARASSPNAARGISSVGFLCIDEAAFVENSMDTYASAVASTSSVRGAKIVLISTPNGHEQLFYQTYKQALEKKNGFEIVSFKWFQDPRYNRFLKWYKKDEKSGQIDWIEEKTIDESGRIEFQMEKWEQLEKNGWKPTSPWYKKMCESFNNDPMRIAQELDVSFLGSSDNVVPAEVIEKIRTQDICEPLSDFRDPAEDDTWFWRKPIEGHRYLISADPSVGSADDRTSIQVIDVDGRDEYGMPVLEQIMEYNGRVLGDKLGDMLYKYATLYNNAYIVVDATGGTGDACLLRLKNYWCYKNLYYDDKVMKEYMKRSERSGEKYADMMPGFHFQGNRFALLRNFANMVTDGSFIVRSARLCNELDTWIFKSEDGRMDHQSGAHDDNITCCALALFIYKFSYQRIEADKRTDAAILSSYRSSGMSVRRGEYRPGETVAPKRTYVSPFYSSSSFRNSPRIARIEENIRNPYVWLMAGYR